MTAQSPGSYTLSLLIHGVAAALLALGALLANRPPTDAPKILELVAGAGNNYGATAAPALGSPDGIKVNLAAAEAAAAAAPPPPAVPLAAVEPAPAPVAPAPIPPQPAPVPVPVNQAVAPAKPAAKSAPKTPPKPNFLADLKRLEKKREARIEARYKAQAAAEERRRLADERRRAAEARAGEHVTHIDAEGIAAGVVGGSTSNRTGGAGGKALTSEEGSLLDRYFSLLQSRLVTAFEVAKPPDVSDRLSARVAFLVAADGSISHVRFITPSGNADFDEAVRSTLAHFSSIGPRPDHRSDEIETTFTEKSPDA
jgi:colicin import membrane protein